MLRDYGRAVIYSFPGLEAVGELALPDQEQGEGIAVDDSGAVFVSSEGQLSPVYRVRVPNGLARIVDPPPPGASDSPSAEPTDGASDADGDGLDVERPTWVWLLGGFVGIGIIVVLLRSLRPR